MRDEHRQHAPVFPSRCEVHGCSQSPQEWFETDRLTFDVCSTHGLQLRAGEAFTATAEEILVGSDAAAELLGTRSRPTSTGRVLTLMLGQHGVTDQEVPIALTPQTRRDLLEVLRPEHADASADGETCEGGAASNDREGADAPWGGDGGEGSDGGGRDRSSGFRLHRRDPRHR